jgi:hypothetical protein
VSAALGRDQPAYAVRRWPGGRLAANNARGHLHISFSRHGATVVTDGDRVSFGLADIRPVAPTVAANRVNYQYPRVTEWFANGPAGLEQGFTVTRPRAGKRLTVTVATAGNHAARQAGNIVQFGGAGGLGYGGLIAAATAGDCRRD